jgi:hypothetical protein
MSSKKFLPLKVNRLAAKVEGSLESELNETREKIIYIGTQIKVFEGKIIS